MATASAPRLLTAEDFLGRTDSGHPEELVRGRIVEMSPPDRRCGYVCSLCNFHLRRFVDEHDLGRVMSNGSAVATRRGPDSVGGDDICYYSYTRLPKGRLAKGYGPEVPELVVEVRSPGDRWGTTHEKVGE